MRGGGLTNPVAQPARLSPTEWIYPEMSKDISWRLFFFFLIVYAIVVHAIIFVNI